LHARVPRPKGLWPGAWRAGEKPLRDESAVAERKTDGRTAAPRAGGEAQKRSNTNLFRKAPEDGDGVK